MTWLPKDLMERVVAWPGDANAPGHVNLHWTSDKFHGMAGKPFKDVHSFMQMAHWLTTQPEYAKDIYFCLSTQSHTKLSAAGKVQAVRLAENALWLKAIWLDIDVKPEKGYATLAEAYDALTKLVKDNNLPAPSALVHSGSGLHVYWVSDRGLTVTEWKPFAYGLRDVAVRAGLKCDAGLTTDAARVLRVAGTFNRKTDIPRPVILKHLGASYDFNVALAALAVSGAPLVTAPVTKQLNAAALDLTAFAGYKPPALLSDLDPQSEKLSAGIQQRSDLPLKVAPLMNCPHFQEALNTGGKGYPQGLWMQDVLASVFTEGGRQFAHWLSKGYSAYSKVDTDAMFDRKVADRERGIGWPSCQAFENDGCKLCATCIYKGKINSPLNLTSRIDPPPEEVRPPMLADKMVNPAPDDYDLMLPEGYQLNDKGIICKRVAVPKDEGEPAEDVLAELFHFPIGYPMMVGGVNPAMHLKVEYGKDGILDLIIPQAAFSSDQKMREAMDQSFGLIYTPNDKHVRHFMKSWQARLVDANARVNAQPFGWLMPKAGGTTPDGFCYGGHTYFTDGGVGAAGIADPEIKESFTPRGKIDSWYKLLKVITDQHHPALEVLLLGSFAAPLMWIGGEKAGVLWGWSHDSAAHKSTSIDTGTAIWASPPKGKLRADSSELGIQHRLGVLQNLPVVIDEVRQDSEVQTIAKLTGTLTEGGSGAKMKRSGTEQRKQLTWETLMLVGSNQDCRGAILNQNPSTDAGLRRVFVFEVEKRGDTATGVGDMINSLVHNYGQMGKQYSQYLATNRQEIETSGRNIRDEIDKRINFQSEERFWRSLCTAVLTAAVTFNKMTGTEWFHVDEVFEFLAKHYQKQRDYATQNCAVGGSYGSAFNIMNRFFNGTLDYQLWTANMAGRGRSAVTLLHKYPGSVPKPVWVHWVRDQRVVHVSKKMLDEWCAHQQPTVSTDTLWSGLKQHFGAELRDKIQLTAGISNMGQAREQVLEIKVTDGSPWEPNLLSHSTASDLSATSGVPVAETYITEYGGPVSGGLDNAMAQAIDDLALVKANEQ